MKQGNLIDFFHDLQIGTLTYFQAIMKISRQSRSFPDTPKILQTLWKLSGQSGNFSDNPETFQTIKKLSRQSRNFTDSP